MKFPPPSRRPVLHAVALWLALAGVLLRGLVPVGFMADVAADGHGFALMLCAGGQLKAGTDGRPLSDPAAPGQDSHADECPFAVALGAALPATTAGLPLPLAATTESLAQPLRSPSSTASLRRPPPRAPPHLA